jgi:glucose-1-phosphate thymidylyltransferase
MKGVVLAGGLGTRLYPLTHATNKHLLPIYNQPMVYYPIKTLTSAGVRDILIVVGGPHAGHFIRVLRNGVDLGIRHLEFAYQENEGGIPHALSLAEDFADEGPVAVILGDNCTDAKIISPVKRFREGAEIFLKKVKDPRRFGVPSFGDGKSITKITEKPLKPASDYAVTGLYLYDKTVFERIKSLKPSKRGELEVTDLNNLYLMDKMLRWSELKGFWSDAGTFQSLFEVGRYWERKNKNRQNRK